MISKYKVFGLQRSGTNFLHDILELNFLMTDLGEAPLTLLWKHVGFNEKTRNRLNEETDLLTFYIHKSPYKWIDSAIANHVDMVNTHRHVIIDCGIPDEMVQGKNVIYKNQPRLNIRVLAELYYTHVSSWVNDIYHSISVQYEKLLADPIAFIHGIQNYDVKIVPDDPFALEQMVAGMSGGRLVGIPGGRRPLDEQPYKWPFIPQYVDMTGKLWDEHRRQYALNPDEFNYLSDDNLAVINRTLPPKFIEKLGYDVITKGSMVSFGPEYDSLQTP